jgi:PAS domain S-box-containing protein
MNSNSTRCNFPEIDSRTIFIILQCLQAFDSEGAFFIDPTLNFIYYNLFIKTLFKLNDNETKAFFNSFSSTQTNLIKSAINKSYQKNLIVETAVTFASKSHSHTFKLLLQPFTDINKKPIGVIGKLIPVNSTNETTQPLTENPNPIFRVLHTGEVVYNNNASEEILERLNTRNKIIKDNIFHFNLNKAIANDDRIQYTLNNVSEKAYTLVLIPSKENLYVTVYATDITEIAELQMSLIKSRADIKTALNSANQMMVMMNKRMSILAFNNKASVMAFRMSNKYLITGTIASEYLSEELRERFIENFNKCVKEGKKNSYETQIYDKAVGNKWYNLVYNPVHDDLSDQVIGVCFSAEDITISKNESLKIEEQRNFYETILNNLPSDLAVFNEKHEYLFVNPAAIASANVRKWIIGKTDFDYCEMKKTSTGLAVSRREIFEKALDTGKEITLESEHLLANGETQYVMRKYSPCYENGKLKLMIGYGVDISENKRSQLKLIQSEHRYRTLFENNPLMVFIVDKNSNIVSANARVRNELGYSKEEIIGQSILNILPKDQYESFTGQISECFEYPDNEFTWETLHLNSKGATIHVEATAKVIVSESGERQLLIVSNNINTRKENEILLEESENLNRRLIQELPLPVAMIEDGKTILANQAYIDLLGQPNSNQNTLPLINHLVDEDKTIHFYNQNQVEHSIAVPEYQVSINTADNKLKHVNINSRAFKYKEKYVTLTVLNDITQKVIVEANNREIEERTKLIIDTALDAVIIADQEGTIYSWNRQATKMFGWSEKEAIGQKLHETIIPARYRNNHLKGMHRFAITGESRMLNQLIEISATNSSNEEFPIEMFITEIIVSGKKYLSSFIRDISDRKNSEKIIRERELHDNIINAFSSEVYKLDCVEAITKAITRNCAKLFNAAETSVFIVDPFSNDLRRQNSIIASSEGIRESLNDLIIPEGSGIVGHVAKTGQSAIVADSEKDERHLIGSVNPGSEIAVPIVIHNKVWGVIDSENETKHFYSEKHLSLLKRISEVAAFKISKVLDTLEQKRINRVLIRNNTQLQQYSYIVSHNLRAPIANLLGLAKMFKRSTPCAEINGMIIDKMMTSASNIDLVITDLNEILATKKDLSSTMELVEFEPIINSVLLGLADEIQAVKPIITIDLQCKGTNAIRSYITSIFSNLISNALKYRSKDRTCELHIRSMPLGNECVLEFSDNGLGIDLQKHGDKIFGLYKRFHPNINGSGIGLHLVKSQLDAMNGSIEVRSEVNAGTTFTIHFYQE